MPSVNLKLAAVDSAAEIASAPSIWIGHPFEVTGAEWTRVPTAPDANAIDRSLGITNVMDALNPWHGVQFYSEDTYALKDANGGVSTDFDVEKTLLVRSGGMQSFLSFFPEAGQTVWLRSFTEYETEAAPEGPPNEHNIIPRTPGFNMVKDSDGKLIVKTPTDPPAVSDPFRFVGTAGRDRPFIVGPFVRHTSVWIYASANISLGWMTLIGSNRGVNAIVG